MQEPCRYVKGQVHSPHLQFVLVFMKECVCAGQSLHMTQALQYMNGHAVDYSSIAGAAFLLIYN